MTAQIEALASRLGLVHRVIEGALYQPDDWTFEDKDALTGGTAVVEIDVKDDVITATFTIRASGDLVVLKLRGEPLFMVPTGDVRGETMIVISARVPSLINL